MNAAAEPASCPIGNSFTPGTKVLMADGSSKPIEDVKLGDKIFATDPETGETRVETVTAEIQVRCQAARQGHHRPRR